MDKIQFTLPSVTEKSDDYIRPKNDIEIQDQTVQDPVPENDAESHDPNTFAGRLDDKGRPFDPNIHVSPAEKTPTGRWRKKPREKIAKKELDTDIRAEAQKIAFLYAGLHVMIFGEDGAIDESGVVSLTNSYERLMAEKGIIQTPPILDVILASAIYTSSIIMRPNNAKKTKGFFIGLWTKLKLWLSKAKIKPKMKKETVKEPAAIKTSVWDTLAGSDR